MDGWWDGVLGRGIKTVFGWVFKGEFRGCSIYIYMMMRHDETNWMSRALSVGVITTHWAGVWEGKAWLDLDLRLGYFFL